jgi:hypothetical protein
MFKFRYFAIFLAVVFVYSSAQAFDEKDYEKLLRGDKTCRKCNLYRANLAGFNLTGIDLSGANLKYVNFQKATLFRVNLKGSNLKGAKFDGALWIDGKYICQPGSIGRCIKKKTEVDNNHLMDMLSE